MAQFEYFELEEIVKNNNLNFSSENWNTQTINNIIPFIKNYLKNKNKTINTRYSATKLKRIFEKLIGHIYITCEDFVIAMLACGFKLSTKKMEFNFNVAEKDIKNIDKILNPEFYV